MIMIPTSAPVDARTKANRFRAGYSFTEVMFAVVVLGIGFIMIAAMFPVAISQQQSTQQESNAAAIGRAAAARINAIAYTAYVTPATTPPTPRPDAQQNMPPTEPAPDPAPAPFVPFDKLETVTAGTANHGRFHALSGDMIEAGDRRFAFVPFYQREFGSSSATVTVIAVRVRARSTYDSTDITTSAARPRVNLMPRPVKLNLTNVANGTDTVLIEDLTGVGGVAGASEAVAEGSYILVSQDPARATPVKPAGTYNGYVFRVGLQSRDANGNLIPNRWDLAPGSDFKPLPGTDGLYGTADDWLLGDDAVAYIVGREYDLETPAPDDFRGQAQDVAVYTTFTQVR
jgi:type II secretory pathway pseudopilin PulG